MTKARVVIGAGYGDEGKGLITDYLSNEDSIVVRFNGGAQAGHTVVTPGGVRHIFGHFGAGTLRGAGTFLSKHFIVNPMLFVKELVKLGDILEHRPKVFIDRNAYVTTPFDIMLNQAIENYRGDSRHGSCGVGFGETIERSEVYKGFILRAGDLEDHSTVRTMLHKIRDEYVPLRLKYLRMTDVMMNYLHDDSIIEAYIANIDTMLAFAAISDHEMLIGHPSLVFEGAQGLALDQRHAIKDFPHVTRSNCGIKNVIDLSGDIGISELDVTYVTRCYSTRHGAGYLPNEREALAFVDVVDKTNVFNDFQQSLRFAPLGVKNLKRRIRADIADASKSSIKFNNQLAVTCIDQLQENNAELLVSGKFHSKLSRDEFLELLISDIRMKNHFYSTGPTRNDVFCYNNVESVL